MQDILCEGTESRINTPGTCSGNWEYKLKENYMTLLDAIVKAKPAAAKGTYLKSIAISTTMGAGIKINPTSK